MNEHDPTRPLPTDLHAVPNAEVLAMYAYLRPSRATQIQWLNMAEARECAELAREAAAVCQQPGLLAK